MWDNPTRSFKAGERLLILTVLINDQRVVQCSIELLFQHPPGSIMTAQLQNEFKEKNASHGDKKYLDSYETCFIVRVFNHWQHLWQAFLRFAYRASSGTSRVQEGVKLPGSTMGVTGLERYLMTKHSSACPLVSIAALAEKYRWVSGMLGIFVLLSLTLNCALSPWSHNQVIFAKVFVPPSGFKPGSPASRSHLYTPSLRYPLIWRL